LSLLHAPDLLTSNSNADVTRGSTSLRNTCDAPPKTPSSDTGSTSLLPCLSPSLGCAQCRLSIGISHQPSLVRVSSCLPRNSAPSLCGCDWFVGSYDFGRCVSFLLGEQARIPIPGAFAPSHRESDVQLASRENQTIRSWRLHLRLLVVFLLASFVHIETGKAEVSPII